MRIIITTYDGHRNILEANKYTMDKFGGSDLDVTILGFKKPDFNMGSWKFVSMGNYISANNFSNDIMPFFNDFNDEYFILGNDDIVLTNKFNNKFLLEIIETVKKIPNFGRMWLTQTPLSYYGGGTVIKSFDDYYIAEINQWADYRLSLQYSIWKTSYFKKYLLPNLSPWQWELRDNAKYDGAAILLPINNFVINFGHIMKMGVMLDNWHKSIYGNGELCEDDIKAIKNIFKKHKIGNYK